MIATDRERLERTLETYPFDTVTRFIYADLLEEEGDWTHAAQRETARVTDTRFSPGWDHPVAAMFTHFDESWWQLQADRGYRTATRYSCEIAVVRFPSAVKLRESWAVHPLAGFRQEDMTITEYSEWMLVNYHQKVVNIYAHPNLFAKMLIQENYR